MEYIVKSSQAIQLVEYKATSRRKRMLDIQVLVGRETWATLEIWATPLPHTKIQKNTKNVTLEALNSPSYQLIQALLRPF